MRKTAKKESLSLSVNAFNVMLHLGYLMQIQANLVTPSEINFAAHAPRTSLFSFDVTRWFHQFSKWIAAFPATMFFFPINAA